MRAARVVRWSGLVGVASAALVMASPAVARGQAMPAASALVAGARLSQTPAVTRVAAQAPLQPALARTDTVEAAGRRTPGLRGALIGALVGAGAGALFARATCDAENCVSHPDTRRILVGGIGVGALVGFTVDVVFLSPRRSRVRARSVAGARSIEAVDNFGRR